MDILIDQQFIFTLLSASALPFLAILALVLRRNLFKGRWKNVFLVLGLALLGFAVYETLHEHGGELTWEDGLIGIVTASVTVYILSRFNHGHSHAKEAYGAKGIAISEAFHSLLDGAVIGSSYLVNPLLGYAATVGIITHELPKIVGTITVFRSLGLSIKQTIMYGVFAQIGSPVAAVLVYILGARFSHEDFQAFEIASISSLGAIVLWIIYLEIRFHTKHDKHTH